MTIKNMPVICKMTVYWLSHVKYPIEKDLTSVNKKNQRKGRQLILMQYIHSVTINHTICILEL